MPNLDVSLGRLPAVVAACLITYGTGTTVHAATSSSRHCAILLGAAVPGGLSPVRGAACSAGSQESVRAALRARAPAFAKEEVPIMIWYEGFEYRGNSTVVYGEHGHCDAAGYTVYPNMYWKRSLQSIKGAAYCDRVRINDGAVLDLPAPRLGVSNVSKIHAWASR